MMGVQPQEPDCSEFVEVDPTGRYGRYNEILGKGASKTVYRAFDEYEGIEVAWNQVKLYDFLQSPGDLERLYCEIHLLKTLKHKNIIKFYTSWVDTSKRNINFVTEMFTSGTLRQYRQKHRRVNIRAVKHWCRQILSGLRYLHSHDPPVIHRDLKCDNIFINGNQGEVKIGDLGLATILRNSHAAHCVGTPEFMAPEVYEEDYNELVDVYSFGMCVLEMVTFEYPYSECIHPVEIYKKVVSGTKPEALYKVEDPEVRQFVEKCFATASCRLSARELLNDPFLQIDKHSSGYREGNIYDMGHLLRRPSLNPNGSVVTSGFSDDCHNETDIECVWNYSCADIDTIAIDLFNTQEDEPSTNVDITIKGRKKKDGGVFLRLRITDRDGRIRNIYFPFDLEADTALSVAAEMHTELDITDYEVTRIAKMIDGEVSSLVPGWKPGPEIEEAPTLCKSCASNASSCSSLLDYLSLKDQRCVNLKSTHCAHLECASMHGRFEEITYQDKGSEACVTERHPVLSAGQSDGFESCSQASGGSQCDDEGSQLVPSAANERQFLMNGHMETGTRKSVGSLYSSSYQQHCLEMPESGNQHPLPCSSDNYENNMSQELRWVRAKYKLELRDYRNQQVGGPQRVLHLSPDFGDKDRMPENGVLNYLDLAPLLAPNDRLMQSYNLGTDFSFPIPQVDTNRVSTKKHPLVYTSARNCTTGHPDMEGRALHCEANPESDRLSICTPRNFYAGAHRPFARTKSLLVDAVDFRNP